MVIRVQNQRLEVLIISHSRSSQQKSWSVWVACHREKFFSNCEVAVMWSTLEGILAVLLLDEHDINNQCALFDFHYDPSWIFGGQPPDEPSAIICS